MIELMRAFLEDFFLLSQVFLVAMATGAGLMAGFRLLFPRIKVEVRL